MIKKLSRKLSKIPVRSLQLLAYIFYQKLFFRITNTKFNISFIVFRESFLDDIYRIKGFIRQLGVIDSLLFLDVGRNHGLVFYYFMHELRKKNIKIDRIKYVGIDPSPLKFVYYPKPPAGTNVSYRIIDRAVVFADDKTVRLKYGEKNLGNFNVTGSNYEKKMASTASGYDFIEIEVDTIHIEELLEIVREAGHYEAAIVKVDCKNQTEIIMEKSLEVLSGNNMPYLVACERDGSSEGRLDKVAQSHGPSLVVSSLTDDS